MKKLALALSVIALTACNNTQKDKNVTQESTQKPKEEIVIPEVLAADIELNISGGDDMKFDKTELRVKEGKSVKLILKHTGEAPITAMGHNFVILAKGTDVDAFGNAAIDAIDNDYIPKGMENAVIVKTEMIGGGETTQIIFTAPPKGTYDFICSFPGHFFSMQGKFIVE